MNAGEEGLVENVKTVGGASARTQKGDKSMVTEGKG
jgi:hypothetical protein